MTRRQWPPMMAALVLIPILAGCAGQADSPQTAASAARPPRRSAATVSTTTTPTPSKTPSASKTPGPAVSVADARGVEVSTVPDWITDADQQLAARFVILANTPDGRVDESATSAWRRAAALATPKLAADMTSGRAPLGGEFAQVRAKKGWMSVSIDNVMGGAQAPGASAGSGPIPILFTQAIHVGNQVTRDQTVQEWDVTVTGGRVADFDVKEI